MSPVNVRTNSGLFRTWCTDFKNFEPKSAGRAYTPSLRLVMPRPLPHLGAGAFLVTAFVSAFFVADLADALAVIVGHSWHAYFHEGLRIVNWKHNVLSNGEYLSPTGHLVKGIASLSLWAAAIGATDFCSLVIQRIIGRHGRWTETAFRLVGGTALLAFGANIYRQANYPWALHPIPISALVGGAILVWRGLASIWQHQFKPEN